MKHLIFISILGLIPSFSQAQFLNDFGFSVNGSVSNAHVTNPLIPEDGTFAYNEIRSLGFGLFANHRVRKRMLIEGGLNYLTKGFSSMEQLSPAYTKTTNYQFRYVSLDGIIKQGVHEFYVLGGLRLDNKISTYFPTQENQAIDVYTGEVIKYYTTKVTKIDNPQASEKISLNEFKKVNLSVLFGAGFYLNTLMNVEAILNHDLAPTYQSKDTALKHLSWSLRLGFNINKILPNSPSTS